MITKTFFTETQQNILHKFNFALPNLKIYNGYKYTQNHHKKFKINHKEEKWRKKYEKIAGKHYIVIEQLTAKMDDGFMEPTKMKSDSSNNLICRHSSSRHTTYINDNNIKDSPKLAYAMYLYSIEIKDDPMELTKEHFINLPSNFKWSPLLITNK